MSAIIAERELDFYDGAGKSGGFVRVFQPAARDGNWWCDYQIEWPGFSQKRAMGGVDSWQALQTTMQIVPVEIAATDAFKAGCLGVFGGSRLLTNSDLIDWLGLKPMKVLNQ